MSARKVNRAKKTFIVVAYDIADDKRRSKIVRILEKVGTRVNLSVFECMLTDAQYIKLRKDISERINAKEDHLAYYPICMNCYAKIVYHLPTARQFDTVTFV